MRNVAYRSAICGILQCQRCPFALRKMPFDFFNTYEFYDETYNVLITNILLKTARNRQILAYFATSFSRSRIFKLFARLANQFFTQLRSENCKFFAQQRLEKKNWFQIERILTITGTGTLTLTLTGTNPTGTRTLTLTINCALLKTMDYELCTMN